MLGLCSAGYLWWIVSGSENVGLWHILAVGILNSLVLFSFWHFLKTNNLCLSFWQLMGVAILLRLLAIFGDPVLEDDYFRYLLDGCVFVHYGSPYGITPESLFIHNSLPLNCQRLLDHVNNPDYPTIYGPVLQYLFALAYLISPANINVQQIINAIFDLGIILVLTRFASLNWVMLYAWHPLVIKEAVFTAHPDVIAVFFILLSGLLQTRGRDALSTVCLALALASKMYVLVIIPFILVKLNWRYWLLFSLVFAALYAPFLVLGNTDLDVLIRFAQNWRFNASLYYLFDYFLGDALARKALMAVFCMGWCGLILITRQRNDPLPARRAVYAIGLLLLVSPVVNPWYLLWLLPFACVYPTAWAWVASVSMWFSYIIGLHLEHDAVSAYEQPWWGWALVYVPIALALLWPLIRPDGPDSKRPR